MNTPDLSKEKIVAALVISYMPDLYFPERLDKLLKQVSHIVIVDNGSTQDTSLWQKKYRHNDNIIICLNPANVGIATALNQGLHLLSVEGFEWVVTFDQDSTITPGLIRSLLLTVNADSDPGSIALVGANRQDAGTKTIHKWLRPKAGWPFFERITCNQIEADGVSLVITSGTLTSIKAFNKVGSFRDDFFIDYVDFEYSLRVRKAGYRILVSCQAKLLHQLGSKKQKKLFNLLVSPTYHSELRRYFQFRNHIEMLRLYGWSFPHWTIYNFLALLEIIMGILMFEDRKMSKLRACILGSWDGLRKRMGNCQRKL